MEDLVDIWKDRRVFLTGHTGFKGSWLSLWLAKLGAQVRGYSLDPSTDPNLFTAARVHSVVDDIRGDIRNYAKLEACMQEFAPEVIFHLAAQPLVRASYVDPISTYAINIMGTAHLLEAVRKTPSVRAVVVITTDKCYENKEWVWSYRENEPLGGYDPYSSSKACVEILTSSYRCSFFSSATYKQHGVAVATVRAGNVIGGGDWSTDRLIPDLIRGFLNGKPVEIRYPDAVRPWQHVLEPLSGYLMVAEKLLVGDSKYADAWNFGPYEEGAWPVCRIASEMVRRWGGGVEWVKDTGEHPHEATALRLDSSKAHFELGWRPILSMSETIDWIIDWFQGWKKEVDMHVFTRTQIERYEEKLQRSCASNSY